MKFSSALIKTQKETSQKEESLNAILLTKGGFIDKLQAGVYSFLPLGLRVLNKIANIVREEIEKIGGVEILMPALHPKENWEKTGRWESMDSLFKLKSQLGKELALGPTHEEVIVPLVKKKISSFRALPLYLYQIQIKFRDEKRAKSGLLRGREFLMKDLYSFHRDEQDLDRYYLKVQKAYFRIFKRCGIGKKTFLVLASGGTFSEYSHEFQTETPAGEDIFYLCSNCKVGVNKEIVEKVDFKCPQCSGSKLEEKKGIEVGNIFKLYTKFAKPFDLKFLDRDNQFKFVLMGCYGIGITRLMGAIVEINNDQQGIIWPKEVAPFKVHLVALGKEKKIFGFAQKVYHSLLQEKVEVLFDDREKASPGEKLKDADLIGCPLRIVVSAKTMRENKVEVKFREKKRTQLLKVHSAIKMAKDL